MIQAHIKLWIYIVPSSLNTSALLTWCHDAHTVISLVVASSSPLNFLFAGVILLLYFELWSFDEYIKIQVGFLPTVGPF